MKTKSENIKRKKNRKNYTKNPKKLCLLMVYMNVAKTKEKPTKKKMCRENSMQNIEDHAVCVCVCV